MVAVSWYSLSLLVAAVLGAMLGAAALVVPGRQTRTTALFAAANFAAALWSLGYFVEVSVPHTLDLTLAPVLSGGWWLLAAEMVGLAAVPSLWFLFAASQTRRSDLLRGRPLLLAVGSFVYALAVVLTNPVHRLFGDQAGPDAPLVAGPLAYPHWIVSWLLVAWAIRLLLSDQLQRRDRAGRTHAAALAAATGAALVGNIVWAAHIGAGGSVLSADPTPALFVLVNVVIAWGVVGHGFGDLVPLAASSAFRAMADIAVVTDDRLRIAAVNDAAEREFPSARPGDRLEDVLPGAARHAHDCLDSECDYLPFELEQDGRLYWGRIHPTRRRSHVVGCVVLLSDITDLRYAQEQLLRLDERRDGTRPSRSALLR
ncbi:MAG: hypothetical protein C0418_01295 [Coriobacteriaceae bacterium]|nr:hypothetical protein [Coriobacteriaceae bacterium]